MPTLKSHSSPSSKSGETEIDRAQWLSAGLPIHSEASREVRETLSPHPWDNCSFLILCTMEDKKPIPFREIHSL